MDLGPGDVVQTILGRKSTPSLVRARVHCKEPSYVLFLQLYALPTRCAGRNMQSSVPDQTEVGGGGDGKSARVVRRPRRIVVRKARRVQRGRGRSRQLHRRRTM